MGESPGDGPAADNARLVDLGDLDELIRHVDRLVDARQWDGLVDLSERCHRAFERGRQLWPVSSLVEYRLALEAPGRWAAPVVVDGAGRFALGPLPEVAAATHPWEELAPHLTPGPAAALCAHERVLRGDDLTGVELPGPDAFELPRRLQAWEPAYPLATYRWDKADFPSPALPATAAVDPPRGHAARLDDRASTDALTSLVEPWTSESNGHAHAIAVGGTALDAVVALGPGPVRMVELTLADALAVMAWAGASGGAHGRRRGAATGRFGAWWATAAMCGLEDNWPVDPDELGRAANELRWWLWDAAEPTSGWSLHLAVEDPADGVAWAIAATDRR